MDIPLQGTPGILDPRNPTLVSNVDQPVVMGGLVVLQSPADYAASNPRADATVTATLSGSVTTADELTIVVSNPLFANPNFGGLNPSQLSHTYTTVGGDTLATIAEAIAGLFNDDTGAQAVGLRADAAAAVVTFHWGGPVGNLSVATAPVDAPSTITVGGAALTNDVLVAEFSGPAFEVVANAQETAVIGGTVAAGNVTTLTFTNAGVPGLPITVSYTAVAGDTPTTIASALAILAEANSAIMAAEILVIASGPQILVRQPGALGNNTVLTDSVQGSVTVTFGNGGDLSGGKGIPGQTSVVVTSNTTTAQSTTTMATNLAAAITASPALAALGISATGSSAKVVMTTPAAAEPVTVNAWVNTISPKATITGSVVAGDIISLTVTNAGITGGAATASYTAVLGDTTTSIATGLTAAINASALLVAAGITATSATNVVTFAYQQINGQLRFSSTVSPGSETVTLSTTPTETVTVGTNATEVITIANSGKFSGGTGAVVPSNNFQFHHQGSTLNFRYGEPQLIDYPLLVDLLNQGMPIV